ncbi:hypothetical protein L9G74_07720 [Shewanella sp. C32]|uniref:Uncharacterized protein n=1 Tax=Shewanella electrica TaxID=515560 RepID=A0ABT2FKY6_9GAMM|nr:hypothetical protein [Shewanella electrica]MCH1924419.1 hypothetical protein [Shewanella electrica]MCS4556320.1 hypothetical protein [Shewanella electrica]
MEHFNALFVWYPFFGLPTAIVGLAIWWRNQRRAELFVWDWGLLFVPFLIWALLSAVDMRGKSLANLVELAYMSGFTMLVMLLRVRLALQQPAKAMFYSKLALLVASASAVLLWGIVPPLAE